MANIMFASELDKKYSKDGIHAFSCHPGLIETSLFNTAQENLNILGNI